MAQFTVVNSAFLASNKSIFDVVMLAGANGGLLSQTTMANGFPISGTSTYLNAYPPQRMNDALGRVRIAKHQNIYEADFEYGLQPLRWEAFTYNTGAAGAQSSITARSDLGGVQMTIGNTAGDTTIRQSRPYQRYQPGKTMFMATAMWFGPAANGQLQRVGFFDDGNGIFFEQANTVAGTTTGTNNGTGMGVVLRSDVSGLQYANSTPGQYPFNTDTRIEMSDWNGDKAIINSINWNSIQMMWMEYTWYGAGCVRWGVFLDGQPYELHRMAMGNKTATSTYLANSSPWARTGNLPVRYEQRNVTNQAGAGAINNMYHFGVSVMVEGGVDPQRGFTYSYGMSPQTPRRTINAGVTRYPVLTVQARPMGTQEYGSPGQGITSNSAITSGNSTSITVTGTPWTANQWTGRCIYFSNSSGGKAIARITSTNATSITFQDNVLGTANSTGVPAGLTGAGNTYIIGQPNRGQLLPQQLLVSSDALCVVELIAGSQVNSPVTLSNASFTPMTSLGSAYSFGTRDVSANSMSGGEVTMAFTAPAGGSGLQQIDLSNFFPLYNNIRGSSPDTLTVAVTTSSSAANVGVHIIGQEAMS